MKDWRKKLLISVLVALSSELYWNIFADGFRISMSVILLPILLMTLGRGLSTVITCAMTAGIVLLFRTFLSAGSISMVSSTVVQLLPNAVFYLCYGILFSIMIPNKHICSYKSLFPTIFVSDFISNIVELGIFESWQTESFSVRMAGTLAAIALFRTLFSVLFILAASQYGALLKKEEHENRYQRLFLMTTGLKNEIYFMRKNTEEIESVMANAYKLYEKLSALDVPDDMKQMSLAIARDVHEIKKDYIRIIQGMEKEISDEYDEKQMSFQDLLKILKETTYHLLVDKELKIELEFICIDDFMTEKHYELMAVLKNIVNNAIEAIESEKKQGTILLRERLAGDFYEFMIKDDGPGISPRHLPNIFKMGYSTKFDYKTGNIYRGVGLYGVKSTVEETFGGTIQVTSDSENGTVFTIMIPVTALEGK